MTQYTKAQMELLKASFELGCAQRDLEEADRKWKAALDKVSKLEQLALTEK